LPSTPWESAGEAGWEKEFEVEELFPACPLSNSTSDGLQFLSSEEGFPVIYSRELVDHLQQRREVVPFVCRAMGLQEWLEPSRYTRTDE
jgi:hypothetical protein